MEWLLPTRAKETRGPGRREETLEVHKGATRPRKWAVEAVQQRPVAAALRDLACWVFFGWAGAAEEKTQGQAELSFRKK